MSKVQRMCLLHALRVFSLRRAAAVRDLFWLCCDSQDSKTPLSERDIRLQTLLGTFADVFEPLSASNVQSDITPEAVPVQPGATPPNMPAFRRSR